MKSLTAEQNFMIGRLETFKAYVLDSMADGMHEEFSDHNDFIAAALETWLGMQDDGESEAK